MRRVLALLLCAVLLLVTGCTVSGAPAVDDERVVELVRREYGDSVRVVSVERGSTLVETEMPWPHSVREPTHTVLMNLSDLPLTLRLRVLDYEMAQYEPGYDPMQSGEWYMPLVPSSIGLSVGEIESLLAAYAAGSAETEAAGIFPAYMALESALGATELESDGRKYDIDECWVVSADAEGWHMSGLTGDGDHVLHIDPESGDATYLGEYSVVFAGTVPQ